MEKERDEYLEKMKHIKRDPDRKSCRNGYYDRDYTTKVSYNLKLPRTRDGKFSTKILKNTKIEKHYSNYARDVYTRSIY